MSLVRRLSSYIVKNWVALAVTVLCIVVSTVITVYIPQLGRNAVNAIVSAEDYGKLVFIVIQILVLTAFLGVLSFVQRYSSAYFSQKVIYNIRNDVFASLQRKSFAFYDRIRTGQLMSKTTTDVDRIRRFLGWQLTSFIGSLLLLGLSLVWMLSMSWKLTLLSIVIAPFMFLSIYQFGKKIRPVIKSSREHYGSLTSVLFENLVGLRVVRAFGRENFEKKKLETPNKEFFDASVTAARIRATYIPVIMFLMGLGTVIIYWYGGIEVMQGRLDYGSLLAFIVYLAYLLGPMWMLGMFWGGYQSMAAAGERVFEIIETEPRIKDKPDAITLPPIESYVRFHDVSFGYEKDRLILKNIKLEAKPGETVALLGPTGSGKSTIIRLLPRFYDVTKGKITVDRYDIRHVKLESLRKQIGIVAQETFLFATTIKENIAYGRPDATMEEIVQAAKTAMAHDFIMALPKGYETMVGERGVTLSGGQQQRIAIARALLLDPKILILDDSTSSVDVDTEFEIQRALAALLKDRTTFVITQRVSTIRNADRIIVLKNGEIAEEGTHESLIAKKGDYYRIYQTLYEAQRAFVAPEKGSPTLAVKSSSSKESGE